jgi:hypothetical protein
MHKIKAGEKSNCSQPPHPKGMGYAPGRMPPGFPEFRNLRVFVAQDPSGDQKRIAPKKVAMKTP